MRAAFTRYTKRQLYVYRNFVQNRPFASRRAAAFASSKKNYLGKPLHLGEVKRRHLAIVTPFMSYVLPLRPAGGVRATQLLLLLPKKKAYRIFLDPDCVGTGPKEGAKALTVVKSKKGCTKF